MFACHVDKILHDIEVGFVVFVFLRLHSRPHHAQADAIEPEASAVDYILFGEGPLGIVGIDSWMVWRDFDNHVRTVDY
jgi:hypothetical protein